MTPPPPEVTVAPATLANTIAVEAQAGPAEAATAAPSATEAATTAPTEQASATPAGLIVKASVALVAAPTETQAAPTETAKLAASPVPTPEPTLAPLAPVPVAQPQSGDAAAAEQYTIDLINARRADGGLAPLARDETLMAVARGRVADMVARGYTGHNDPVTGVALGPAMMAAAGFSSGSVGENWYGTINGPPKIAEVAMNWFMTDAPHYRNILGSSYSVVGVGIAFNGRQWLLVQDFAGR